MNDFLTVLPMAMALVCIIEGLLYGLFPAQMRRMMAYVLLLPVKQIQVGGIVMVTIGVAILFLIDLTR